MTKRHQQTLTIVARDRFQLDRGDFDHRKYWVIYDAFKDDYVQLPNGEEGTHLYHEARTACNQLNQDHLALLKWSMNDHLVAVQLELF